MLGFYQVGVEDNLAGDENEKKPSVLVCVWNTLNWRLNRCLWNGRKRQNKDAYTLHKSVRLNFRRRMTFTIGIDNLWQIFQNCQSINPNAVKSFYRFVTKNYSISIAVPPANVACDKLDAWWHIGRVDAFRLKVRGFESRSSRPFLLFKPTTLYISTGH